MRHGWRSSSSGVRTPVRLSVQGPPGEVPATAPFSIPLHHRYRRWTGGVSRPRIFIPVHEPWHTKTRHQTQHTCSSALRHWHRRPPGGAFPPRIPLPLACGRGIELGSSGLQPLQHAATNPLCEPPASTKHPEQVWGDGQLSKSSPVASTSGALLRSLTRHVDCPTACLNLQLADRRRVCVSPSHMQVHK